MCLYGTYHPSERKKAGLNLATAEHSIKNDCYPFCTYKVSKLNRQTAKKAITKKDVMKIMHYQGKSDMEMFGNRRVHILLSYGRNQFHTSSMIGNNPLTCMK